MTELGLNIPSLVAYLINFVVLLGILLVFAYKPLISAIDQRAEKIRESLEAADKAQEDADRFYASINGQQFNSLLEERCQLAYVGKVRHLPKKF